MKIQKLVSLTFYYIFMLKTAPFIFLTSPQSSNGSLSSRSDSPAHKGDPDTHSHSPANSVVTGTRKKIRNATQVNFHKQSFFFPN